MKVPWRPVPLNSSIIGGLFPPMTRSRCVSVSGQRNLVSSIRRWTLRSWVRAVAISCFAAACVLFPPLVASLAWCFRTAGSTANRKRSCTKSTCWVTRPLNLDRCFVVSPAWCVFPFISELTFIRFSIGLVAHPVESGTISSPINELYLSFRTSFWFFP